MVLNAKQGFTVFSLAKTLYPNTLYLLLFFNFIVVSEMSLVMAKVANTYIRSGEHRFVTSYWEEGQTIK